jgi:hypothetical protein
MSLESPAAARSSAVTAGGSAPAVRPFRGRALSEPSSTPLPRPIPLPRRWADAASDNEKLLYGALLPEVVFLRRRGFGVHCEGDLFRVGSRLLDAEGLLAVAARERRLLERS